MKESEALWLLPFSLWPLSHLPGHRPQHPPADLPVTGTQLQHLPRPSLQRTARVSVFFFNYWEAMVGRMGEQVLPQAMHGSCTGSEPKDQTSTSCLASLYLQNNLLRVQGAKTPGKGGRGEGWLPGLVTAGHSHCL